MAEVAHLIEDQEPSPRSTILLAEIRMTAAYPVMNDSNMASDVASPEVKLPTTNKEDLVSSRDDPKASSASEGIVASDRIQEKEKEAQDSSPPTPIPHEYAHHLLAYANLTPQQGSGYYLGYLPHQQHMIPEPASPGPPHTAVYDVSMGSFFQPHSGAAFHPTSTGSPFLVSSAAGTTPLSPSRGSAPALSITGSLPPASPLFPRVSSGGFDITNSQHRVAPNIPYMASAHLGTPPSNSSNYQTYPSVILRSQSSDEGAWGGDSRNQNGYPSPQVSNHGMQMLYGVPLTRGSSGSRAYSFDETMLPAAALDDLANPAYSPYGGSQTSPGGATLFAHQPSWGYGGPPDPYNAPTSPLQPRPAQHPQLGMYPGGGQPGAEGMRSPMGPYGQYFPASSPGPPIQTTASNKGPDGANLFIFHIPNHFTNLDMYQLFTPYGNLLSVRIMVEKDTGRSRGFGFVSYDMPEAAAVAIKELNGFPIGNKRLKVQHKQIRRQDLSDQDSLQDGFGGGSYQRYSMSSLPPSGPNANQHIWFDTARGMESLDDTPESHHQQLLEQDSVAGHDGKSSSGGDLASEDNSEQASPLANLSQLQNALPDIPGNGSSE